MLSTRTCSLDGVIESGDEVHCGELPAPGSVYKHHGLALEHREVDVVENILSVPEIPETQDLLINNFTFSLSKR